MTAKPLRIVSLKVTNIQRIRAVSITPNGDPTVILGGDNGAGKTSVLDAIEMALTGGKAISKDPIRHGAKQGSIVANLGDLVIERVIAPDRTHTLTVRDADGNKQRTPQAILDALCSKIAFDPLAFMALEPKKQNEVLRELLGLDFTALDAERERSYAKRTETTRDAKAVRAQAEGLVVPPTTPAEKVSVADLLAELKAANDLASARKDHARKVTDAETALAAAEDALKRAEAAAMQKRAAVKALAREVLAEPVATDAIEAKLAAAETTNRNVERRGQRDSLEMRANALDGDVKKLTSRIEQIDAEKAAAIAAKPFPVPGLALGEAGPTLDGVPLEQASAAQRLRVSVALGLALNPRLKVLLVRDASLLDSKSLALVTEMAAAAGAQVWLERVGDGDPTAVIIADGQVAEDRTHAANDGEHTAA